MVNLADRKQRYHVLSNKLSSLTDLEIEKVLVDTKVMHQGIGGTSHEVIVENTSIFVKKIPITALEARPENAMSTTNLFNLPMCYHYGIGSAGFGSWRELISHKMTTNWVIEGECPHFPIMYHWRVLKDDQNKVISPEEQASLEKNVIYWENNTSIKNQLMERLVAKQYIYVFLEFIPHHLDEWLPQKLSVNESTAATAVRLVDTQMQNTNAFLQSHGFLHMDAHFKNILTDGTSIYYADLGLALSKNFQLSQDEKTFFAENITYDVTSGMLHLLECLIRAFHKTEVNQFNKILRQYINRNISSFSTSIDSIIQKYAPIVLIMDEFYEAILKDKSTKYPSTVLEGLLRNTTQ